MKRGNHVPALVWILSVMGLMAIVGTRVTLARTTRDVKGTLHVVRWRATAWGEEVVGVACWLRGEDGRLRAEISREEVPPQESIPAALQHLLNRQGEGWTLALATPGAGTWNAWGDRWQDADPQLQAWLRVLTASLEHGPRVQLPAEEAAVRRSPTLQRSRPQPRWLALKSPAGEVSSRLRLQITPPDPLVDGIEEAEGLGQPAPTVFRAAMEHRGLGHGGRQEIVILQWDESSDPEGNFWVRVHSSRRQGKLFLSLPAAYSVYYPVPESFLPLWSLAELGITEPLAAGAERGPHQ